MLETKRLFEFDFISEKDIENVASGIIENIGKCPEDKLPFLITPNVNDIIVYNDKENQSLRHYLVKSQFILPDGQPIVWSSWFKRNGIKKRLPGSDIFPILWHKIKQTKMPSLLLVPGEQIAQMLQAEYTECLMYVLPFFQAADISVIEKIVTECTDLILANNVNMIFIGVTFPKQNLISVGIFEEINKRESGYKNYLIGMIGASFEFYLGLKKRAPVWIRRLGLEWLYRFFSEPRRLFKRYFIDSWKFLPILVKKWKS